jgi:hypothetical protein
MNMPPAAGTLSRTLGLSRRKAEHQHLAMLMNMPPAAGTLSRTLPGIGLSGRKAEDFPIGPALAQADSLDIVFTRAVANGRTTLMRRLYCRLQSICRQALRRYFKRLRRPLAGREGHAPAMCCYAPMIAPMID